MKTINTLLYNIVSGSVFIMLSTAFGNYHIFPETQVISEVDISEFPDNCKECKKVSVNSKRAPQQSPLLVGA